MDFSIKEAIKFGWDKAKSNLKFFIPFLIFYIILQYLPGLILNLISQNIEGVAGVGINGLASIAINLFQIALGLGLIVVALNAVDGKPLKFSDLLSKLQDFKLILKFIGANIIFAGVVILGAILFIVPGIIFGIKLQFFSYYMIDKNLGPLDALRESWRITKGVKLKLFFFQLALVGINILGALLLLVGLFVTIPLSMIAMAYVYRKLSTTPASDSTISKRTLLIAGITGFLLIILIPILLFLVINPPELQRRIDEAGSTNNLEEEMFVYPENSN